MASTWLIARIWDNTPWVPAATAQSSLMIDLVGFINDVSKFLEDQSRVESAGFEVPYIERLWSRVQ